MTNELYGKLNRNRTEFINNKYALNELIEMKNDLKDYSLRIQVINEKTGDTIGKGVIVSGKTAYNLIEFLTNTINEYMEKLEKEFKEL